jgi:hypothetical protein
MGKKKRSSKRTVNEILADILALSPSEQDRLRRKVVKADAWMLRIPTMIQADLTEQVRNLKKPSRRKPKLTKREWQILEDKQHLSWAEMEKKYSANGRLPLETLRTVHRRAWAFVRTHHALGPMYEVVGHGGTVTRLNDVPIWIGETRPPVHFK